MKKRLRLIPTVIYVSVLSPVQAVDLRVQAVDYIVHDRGREYREDTLLRLLSGVLSTQELQVSTQDHLEQILNDKLSIYQPTQPQLFADKWLRTDTSRMSVGFEEILDGGPGKDGIPALYDPIFISQDEAELLEYMRPELEWITVKNRDWSQVRFYPFSILNRHEIVNDTIDGDPIMVTFCPLCGTAIVYSRRIEGMVLEFGVSGLLYQSNLLMYDDKTQTLWSQAFGTAVAGTYTDYELTYMPTQQMTYEQFVQVYPHGVILSHQTWYERDYRSWSPYGDYDTNDRLLFPVDDYDQSLQPKILMIVVNDSRGFSAAFHRAQLLETGKASLRIDDRITLTALVDEAWRITVEDGSFQIPHFTEMRFSRSARNSWSEWWWSDER